MFTCLVLGSDSVLRPSEKRINKGEKVTAVLRLCPIVRIIIEAKTEIPSPSLGLVQKGFRKFI
jgi:hypothetical protein